MQPTPSVAICIPTFNQARYLPDSVRSACTQTYPGVEVWVSDDASTDSTPEVMAQLCRQFPQVRHFRQPGNLGIARNSNWLLRQPTTELLVRLDSDDALEPHFVESLVALLTKHPTAAYAHSAVHEIDENGHKCGVGRLARTEEFRESDKELKASVWGFRMTANIAMFRAFVLRELDFYEARAEYTEDYDLIVRIADAGYGNAYTADVLAAHRRWTDDRAIRPKRKSLELRGMIWVYEQSLLPAFLRRGWDPRPIRRARARLALGHASFCFRPLFSVAERAELVGLLLEVGDSPALRLRLALLRLGFGPVLEWQLEAERKVKASVKSVLARLRTARAS